MRLIGLAGYAGAGKNTFADCISDHGGHIQDSFAYTLKKCLIALDPMYCFRSRVSEGVSLIGWDKLKQVDEVRRLLQVLGTEVGRELLDNDIWVKALENRLNPIYRTVITDVRFPNEAEMIHRRGGVLVWVNRPGVGPVNGHRSDAGLVRALCDLTVMNDGDEESLSNVARDLVEGNASSKVLF